MKLCAALVVAMLVGVVLSETALPNVDAPSAEFLEQEAVEDIHQDDVSQAEEVAAEKAQVNEEMKSLIDSGSSMMKKWKAEAHKGGSHSAEAHSPEDLEEVDEPIEAADLDPRFAHRSQHKVEDDYAEIFHHSKKPAAPKQIHYRPEARDEGEVETGEHTRTTSVLKKVEDDEPAPKAQSKRVQAERAEMEEEAEAVKKQNMVMLRESKARRAKRRAQRTADGLREAAKLMGKKVIGQYLNKPEDKEAKKWLGHTAFVRTVPKSWTKRPKKLSEREQKKNVHKNINWVKKALNMPPDETDQDAAEGKAPDQRAERWMGMIPSHKAKSHHRSKKLVQAMDEEEMQDPRGHHHQQPPSPQLFIGQEQMQRSKGSTRMPPALRMMTAEEHEKEEAMADEADEAREKRHAAKTREIKDSREHRKLERNPVMRNAKPIALPHIKASLPAVHLPNAEEEAAMDSAARAAMRSQRRDRRQAKRRADAKRHTVALAQKQPVKKHKKLTAEEYKRQLHNRVVNNPVFKHARLYGLLKTKNTKKAKHNDAGAFDSKHKGVLSLAGLNTARKNGYKHVSLDFGLND